MTKELRLLTKGDLVEDYLKKLTLDKVQEVFKVLTGNYRVTFRYRFRGESTTLIYYIENNFSTIEIKRALNKVMKDV